MSWSMHAAHSSSRSTGSPPCRPEPRELIEHRERERGDVTRCGPRRAGSGAPGSARSCGAAQRTAAGPGPTSSRSKKMPSRSPASVTSKPVEAARLERSLNGDGAGEDQVGARRLDARNRAALRRGKGRKRSTSSARASRSMTISLHPVRRQPRRALDADGEVAHGAADAHQPPAPALGAGQPLRRGELGATCSRNSSIWRRFAGPLAR